MARSTLVTSIKSLEQLTSQLAEVTRLPIELEHGPAADPAFARYRLYRSDVKHGDRAYIEAHQSRRAGHMLQFLKALILGAHMALDGHGLDGLGTPTNPKLL